MVAKCLQAILQVRTRIFAWPILLRAAPENADRDSQRGRGVSDVQSGDIGSTRRVQLVHEAPQPRAPL